MRLLRRGKNKHCPKREEKRAGRRCIVLITLTLKEPYDDCNYVTSVLPFFYSKNLKKYTDCLVYIPYFVLGEFEPDDEQAVKGMEHFCTAPGVIHADHVIVQSEKICQVYVNVLTKAAGKETKKYWEEKILGLGSPKFDKVQGTLKQYIFWNKML